MLKMRLYECDTIGENRLRFEFIANKYLGLKSSTLKVCRLVYSWLLHLFTTRVLYTDLYYLLTFDFKLRDLEIFASTSDIMPLQATPTPNHPWVVITCPLVKIDKSTEKILRVVVTVEQTSGSKFATV
mmetsp:Transcript_3932/g.4540  ORF Transcript_3932/g.4540 Transcript_3932/m.4540 type:complete len:128 (+) Transcript_3932:125-508(+)